MTRNTKIFTKLIDIASCISVNFKPQKDFIFFPDHKDVDKM